MSPSERDIVLDQALATEDNLRVAMLIAAAFDDLRCRIISRFTEYLVELLRNRFGDSAPWRLWHDIGIDGHLQAGGSLWAVHHVEGERVCVKLGYDKTPEAMYYAILNEQAPARSKVNWVRIKQELDNRFAVGKTSASCRWISVVDHTYRNWYDTEVLLKLWKKDDAARYFTNRLAAIMGIVASVLQSK
jgi:hypothetical protein